MKYCPSFVAIIVIVVTPLFATGQQVPMAFKQVIKPCHLQNQFVNLRMACEGWLMRRTSAPDVGYVFEVNDDQTYRNERGFKLREEFRYFFHRKAFNKIRRCGRSAYGGAELHQYHVNFFQHEQVQKLSENGVGLKIGFAEFFSRVMIDINTGILLRHSNMEPVDISGTISRWIYPESKYFVSPTLGFRAGYVLK